MGKQVNKGKINDRETRKQLGQYFTPPVIAEFMLELVGFDPFWKIIDPACGEGIFLRKALERGCATVVGIDIDPEAIKLAQEFLNGFQSYKLFQQDGIQPIKTDNIFWRGYYDLVIGNPPFSAAGNRIRDLQVLENFELAHVEIEEESKSLQLPFSDETLEIRPKRRKPSLPIEVLFLERFLQLARPAGKVAIILPEGIFANTNLRHVRKWLAEQFCIRAIIGLPRETFKWMGTTAKTAILYVEKKKASKDHQVLLAEVTHLDLSPKATLKANQELIAVLKVMKQLEKNPLSLRS